MDSGWAAVIGALVGSAVTGAVLLVRDFVEARRRRGADIDAAAEAILVHSTSVVQLANALRIMIRIRSGLREGIDVATRQRKLVEPLDLADRVREVFQPMFTAQVVVWAKGGKELVPLANDLVARCVALVDVATEGGEAGSKTRRYVLGERWTDEQEEAYMAAIQAIGDSRLRLADHLRIENRAEPMQA